MSRARFTMLCAACLLSAFGCSGASHHDGSDASKQAPPAKVCTFGADQTCNDNPAISSLHGVCQKDGSCLCHPGFAKTAKGLCR
jgi:hypothetical protein